jgi:hypothetical protein
MRLVGINRDKLRPAEVTGQWNGIFNTDDSQFVDLVVRKRFATDGLPGVEITVASIYLVADRPPVQQELEGSRRSANVVSSTRSASPPSHHGRT